MDLHELSELLALPSLVSDLDALEAAMVDVLREADTLDALVEPGIRVVTGGGKRLRPTLTIAAAAVGGAPANDHVTAAGVAVELVQVGSLVHDDLMDHAKLGEASRRSTLARGSTGPSWLGTTSWRSPAFRRRRFLPTWPTAWPARSPTSPPGRAAR